MAFHEETLFARCLDVHMAISGAADPMTDETLQEERRYLQGRIDRWREPSKPFDAAALLLVYATIAEITRALDHG